MSGNGSERLPTGTVSFLFTDIVGSTPLWDKHPAETREALVRHDEILRKAILAADGHVFSTGGDGLGAVFSRAGNAVAAAVDAQLALRAEPWPEPIDLSVRMGVHTGEVHERDGDYFGPPVNYAARLMGAANGGQIVVSALTAGLLDPSVGVDLVDLGATAPATSTGRACSARSAHGPSSTVIRLPQRSSRRGGWPWRSTRRVSRSARWRCSTRSRALAVSTSAPNTSRRSER